MLPAEMSYELIPAVDHAEKLIRDAKDQPILNAAIVANVDITLTGDKDFLSPDMEHPKCMTVAQLLESEGVEDSTSAPFLLIWQGPGACLKVPAARGQGAGGYSGGQCRVK